MKQKPRRGDIRSKSPFLECGNTMKGQVLQSLLHPDSLVQELGPQVRSRATALEGRVFGLCVAAVHCVTVHLALEPLALKEEISREQLSMSDITGNGIQRNTWVAFMDYF